MFEAVEDVEPSLQVMSAMADLYMQHLVEVTETLISSFAAYV